MKRTIAFYALPAALLTAMMQSGTALAATQLTQSPQSVQGVRLRTIVYQGVGSSQEYGFAASDSGSLTTYMPIWYVANILSRAGIQSTWQNGTLNFSVPNTFRTDLSNLPVPTNNPYYNTTLQINGTTVQQVHSIAYKDPMGGTVTTFVPIWYLQQALNRAGIHSSWNGTTWTLVSTQSFTNVDLRYAAPGSLTAGKIDQFLKANGSPLTGLGQSYIEAQNTYGVDANYLVSHSILESAWGKSQIALAKNNLFGYGAYDANPGSDAGMFPSDDYAIRFEAWAVRQNYLNPGGSNYVAPTLTGMNVNYATDPNWASSIGQIMGQVAAATGSSVTDYVQYQGNNAPAPAPPSNVEPVYDLNGAQAVIQPNPYYGGLPYYPDMGTGVDDMFFAPLQNGSFGASVVQVQKFLNQQINAHLTTDGQFGPLTETAVKTYQQLQGLTVNGIWDYNMWQAIHPTGTNILQAGSTVSVDQIEQGMANGIVVPWYHIPNYGWVDSQYVQLTNVYRITVPNPASTNTTVNVYDPANPSQVIATLHSGDFVVSSNPAPQNNLISIQFCNPLTGQAETGVLQASTATLTQQN